ncbi:phosphate regulon transcriptional regulator PhoB [Neisseria dentiae]|uniref:phosphate regulon transcriptional regulator PhoB n=1 Tax=Neisseria dentiae TaxID=194197 RepID=UPI00359F5FF0
MPQVNILAIEDEEAIGRLIGFVLEQAGFQVTVVPGVENALPLLAAELPDMVLVDWMLPGASGLQLIKQLRQNTRTRDLPIIMLTARGTESDKEQGLNLGADDYVTKPFSPRELIARVNALLRRRAPQKTEQTIEAGGLTVNPAEQTASANGTPVALGPSEFKLLHFFITHPNRAYNRRQLLDLVWGDHVFVEERTVDVHISRLRRALEEGGAGNCIQTVRGLGYRFYTESGETP